MSLTIITYKISFKNLLWLFFLVFFIHNTEEFLTASGWMKGNLNKLPDFVRSMITPYITEDFQILYGIALALAALLPLLIIIWSNRTKNVSLSFFLIITLSWIVLINGLQHLANTLMLNKYTPGFLTALFVNLPFIIYFFLRLIKEKGISSNRIFLYFPFGLFAYVIGLISILVISYNILILFSI